MLTLRQLRAFILASRSLSFTVAAQQLHLTQSAISLLIRDLEADLGLRLFERGRRLALTEAGVEFARAAEKVQTDLELAVANVRDNYDARRGVIRIGVGHLLAAALFPIVVAEFRRRRPAVTVQIVDCPVEQLAQRVLAGEVDLAIGSIRPDARSPVLQFEPMFRDSIHVAWATGSREPEPLRTRRQRHGTGIPWRSLEGEPMILVNAGNRIWATISAALSEQGWHLTVAHHVALYSTGISLARSGLGRLLLPGFCAGTPELHGLTVTPLIRPVIRWDVSILRRRGAEANPAAGELVELLRRTVKARTAALA